MSEKIISEGQYRYIKGKLNELSCQLSYVMFELRQQKASRKKLFLDFEEAIPPKSVCKDAISMLGVGNYTGMLRLLSDYYGVIPLQLLHDAEKVPEGAIACYYRGEGIAYSKERTIDNPSVLHEFFHHLVTQRVVTLRKEDDEEKLAKKYAELFLQRVHGE